MLRLSKRLTALSLFVIFFSCNSPQKVKPRPVEGNYEICPLCKGAGIAEIYRIKSSHAIQGGNKEADVAEKAEPVTRACCCLFSFFTFADDIASGEGPAEKEDPGWYYKDGEHRDTDGLRDFHRGNIYEREYLESSKPSTVKRRVKCPRCNGTGWIRVDGASGDAGITDAEFYERLRKLNEGIEEK